MGKMTCTIRDTVIEDSPQILSFIRKLAGFEHLLDAVTVTESDIRRDLFERRLASAVFVETASMTVGFALYFFNYSTFRGKPGLYLEDLFIEEAYRGHGFAHEVFRFLSGKARAMGCSRLEWSVLDWNEKAINFYRSLGAKPHGGWSIYRLELDSQDKSPI
jgi:GNAT superfamily N-acetyltransferase